MNWNSIIIWCTRLGQLYSIISKSIQFFCILSTSHPDSFKLFPWVNLPLVFAGALHKCRAAGETWEPIPLKNVAPILSSWEWIALIFLTHREWPCTRILQTWGNHLRTTPLMNIFRLVFFPKVQQIHRSCKALLWNLHPSSPLRCCE